MVPVTSLLTAIARKDVAVLNDLIEHDGMAEAHFTHEEAVALWEAGWQEWLGDGKAGDAHCQAGEGWCEFHQVSWEDKTSAGSPRPACILRRSGTSRWECSYTCSMPGALSYQVRP
jgi:hypothetical protein